MTRLFVALFFAATMFCFSQQQNPHSIPSDTARSYIARFQSTTQLKTFNVHAGTVPASVLQRLLNQKGATSLRYYWGLTNDLRISLVLVAADGKNDILGMIYANDNGVSALDNLISRAEAKSRILLYAKSSLFQEFGGLYGGTFPKDVILNAANRIAGLRLYFGKNPQNSATVVVSGVTFSGADANDALLDRASPCPPTCTDPPQIIE